LNRYPYNNGHLMIAPFRHVGKLEELRDEELTEIWKTAQLCVSALKSGLKPKGIILGMNLGKVSGAGVGDHIHLHIVPRWQGDANFMPIFAETKVISVGLSNTYRLLKKELRGIDKKHSKRRSADRRRRT
ncbi:MAG: HIT domain-containing protein, partial [Candidatus Zixiibacteriota bacterium]